MERFDSGFGKALQDIVGINLLGVSKGRAAGPQPSPVPVTLQAPSALALDQLLDSILNAK